MNEVRNFEAEAEAARVRIVNAIAQLGDRLSPRTIIRETKAEGRKALLDARDQAADAVDQAERFVMQNAWAFGVGSAVIGVVATIALRNDDWDRFYKNRDKYSDYAHGDAYAVDAIRSRSSRTPRFARARDQFAHARALLADVATRAVDAVAGAQSSVAHGYRRVAEGASEQASMVGEKIAARLDHARDTANDTAAAISDAARTGVRRTSDAVADNPEAAVLLAVAAGAVLALVSAGGARLPRKDGDQRPINAPWSGVGASGVITP